jgi:hypothetical protein
MGSQRRIMASGAKVHCVRRPLRRATRLGTMSASSVPDAFEWQQPMKDAK